MVLRADRASWRWVLGWNALLAAAAVTAHAALAPEPLRLLAAGLLVLVIPGAGWLGAFRGRALGPASLAFAVVGISTLATLGALAATALGADEPSRGLAVAWNVLILNSGFVLAGRPGPLRAEVRWGVLAAVAAGAFVVIALSALYVVPPLEDHDMELRGTAWGLATTFEPYYLTNRQLYIQAAHPVLFHFHIAESLLFTGEIAATRSSFESAKRAEAALARGETPAWDDWWRADYQALLDRPALAGTRAPSCLLSALALGLLAHLVIRMTGSAGAGVAAAGLFLSFPESVVRCAYAGYFPVTLFASLVVALLVAHEAVETRGPWAWLAGAGAFAATVNHKTVVLVLAVAALAGLASILRATLRVDRAAMALAAGFAAGTFVWWGYGLTVNADAFIEDHLRKHIAHRALFDDLRLGDSPERYAPGMLELWTEFSEHTGWLFVPVAIAGLAVVALSPRYRGPDLATSIGPLLAAWFLTGTVLYTLTDWRQTKHLMNQLTPMVAAAVALAWPLRERPARWARATAAVALVAVLLLNLRADVRLIRDFPRFRISGASDIDGW